jgi:GT2 family glycosyltransferase
LETIVTVNRDDFELNSVTVVDNASTDFSVENLGDLDLPLNIIRNNTNRGFAAACNQAAKSTKADYLLFLNPDTRLFADSLSKPLKFMENENNRNIGIVGIQLIDERGKVSRSCSYFPTPARLFVAMTGLNRLSSKVFPGHFMSEWDHAQTMKVDQVMGAFFMTRRSVFESLGGFDELFFVYYEDVDFSWRAFKKGWETMYLVEAQAYHRGGGSSEKVKASRLFYFLRSRIQYGYKHFGCFTATLLLIGTILLEPLARLVFAACRRSVRDMLEILEAFGKLWVNLPAITSCQNSKRKR